MITHKFNIGEYQKTVDHEWKSSHPSNAQLGERRTEIGEMAVDVLTSYLQSGFRWMTPEMVSAPYLVIEKQDSLDPRCIHRFIHKTGIWYHQEADWMDKLGIDYMSLRWMKLEVGGTVLLYKACDN